MKHVKPHPFSLFVHALDVKRLDVTEIITYVAKF